VYINMKMMRKYLKTMTKSENGYASFVITLVTMIIVSLIVIAFAADSRLEQKDSLANNLATQAYYAAESGINDGYAIVSADVAKGVTPIPASTSGDCTPNQYVNITNPGITQSNYVNGTQVQYTCLVVNPKPSSLEYPGITPGGNGQVVDVDDANNNGLLSITISWDDPDATQTFDHCPRPNGAAAAFPNILNSSELSPTECGAGVLQVDMVSNTAVSNNPEAPGETVFLEPEHTNSHTAASNSFVNPTQLDQVYYVDCNSTPVTGKAYSCTENILTNGLGSDSNYYLHLQSFYQTANVSITATEDDQAPASFTNAQVLIDSTGEATGQLKRLQERVCYGSFCNSNGPATAIQSDSCIDKQFTVYPSGPSQTPTTCP
jgi:hypothetical protein